MPSPHFSSTPQFPPCVPYWLNPTGSHRSMEFIDVVRASQPPRSGSRRRKVEVGLEGQTEVILHTTVPQCLEYNLKKIAQRIEAKRI